MYCVLGVFLEDVKVAYAVFCKEWAGHRAMEPGMCLSTSKHQVDGGVAYFQTSPVQSRMNAQDITLFLEGHIPSELKTPVPKRELN